MKVILVAMLMTQRHTLAELTLKLTVIVELQITANKLIHWFEYNHLKANPGKNHLLTTKIYRWRLTYHKYN